MLSRRAALVVLTTLSLILPIGIGPKESSAGPATGFKGTVKRLPESSLARRALRVLAINPNRLLVVGSDGLNKESRYRMEVPAGLYMVGANGLRTNDGFTHAIRLHKGQMRTVDLPPGTGSRTTVAAPTSIGPAAAGGGPVVTVGPITVDGISDFREGADLWMLLQGELEEGSRTRCKVTYTSDQIRALVRQELEFQRNHNVDESTKIKPNFVTPTLRVSGTISKSGDVVTMALKVKDLETGEIKQTESVSGPKSSFLDLTESLGRKVGRNLCRRTRVTGTITYNETTVFTSTVCCDEQESLDATIDVAMKAASGNDSFLDDGSSYEIQYARNSSGEQSNCNYEGEWSGSGAGPHMVGAGKLIEPGDIHPITGEPAETYELVVGVHRELNYTYSGSETYSACANSSNNGTIPHPEANGYLEDVYEACEGAGFLVFKSENETSKTLSLSCQRTDGDTDYTLDGTLEIED